MEKVAEESLFNTVQSLNTEEHPIMQCMGLGQGKESII